MISRIRSWWQRMAQGGKDPVLRHAGRLPLTAQHVLHCVEYEGRRLLVATHPGGITLFPAEAADAVAGERVRETGPGARAGRSTGAAA